MMRMIIVGAGAMGLLWAGKCAPHLDVTLVTHSLEQSEEINRSGIQFVNAQGDPAEIKVNALSISDIDHFLNVDYSGITWVILAVKQIHIASVAKVFKQASDSRFRFLALQNGMGHAERLAESINRELLSYGVTTMGARRTDTAEVHETGEGDTFVGPSSKELLFLSQLISPGIKLNVVEDIHERQWEKLVVNAVINPITTILETSNGGLHEAITNGNNKHVVTGLIEEAVAVARTQGYMLNPEDLFDKVMNVLTKTCRNHSSMLQDLMNGRETEIDYINGFITRTGKNAAIETPLHEMLTFLIQTKTKSRMNQI